MPAAPAPENTIRTSSIRLPTTTRPVEQGRSRDDGGAVLVVVEDRDIEPTAQFLLDVEALGRLDVLEVDPSEGGRQRGDDPDQVVWVAGVDLEIEDVDPGEPFEQHGLALHDRLGRQRPDVAQAEHGRAVGHDRHEVPLPRVPVHQLGTVLDGKARTGHARCVGQREIVLSYARFRRDDLDLPRPWKLVVLEHFLVTDHTHPSDSELPPARGGQRRAVLTGDRQRKPPAAPRTGRDPDRRPPTRRAHRRLAFGARHCASRASRRPEHQRLVTHHLQGTAPVTSTLHRPTPD